MFICASIWWERLNWYVINAWPAARDNLGTNCTIEVEHIDILSVVYSIQIRHELQ